MLSEFSFDQFLFLLEAAQWTLLLSALAFVGGGIAGFIVALMRTSHIQALRFISAVYIQIIQGTPVLIILFLSFYGLAIFGYKLPPMVAATIAMTIYASAYLGEIWRGCIEAVPVPQWEASTALAMTRWQQLRYVILPQAMRISLPPTVGFLVQIVKNTSIASIIGLVELAQAGKLVSNATFQPFLVFPVVAAIYFVFCYPLSRFSFALERKLHAHR
ncbi:MULTISPECIES: amino acid ABC transporter permease [unclassified Herbaspirillum]|uniref:amino acid ABC transporter permease n=1 Tax=unclassified Herbaspirillum TaxID=2624150 RepID=UPI00114E3D57|nr:MULTISPECIES: amino acid ABC transporter permease [unclassified Herbaspirillum]MBB5391109.1 polar amino acid transport system permease protein [Herbaspirillum sp. SJZ102]TQK13200.1 amino acid ABC transporter membrane protein 2 (PAAT family) [Herbaspirillum sp. SJZ130]TQK15204.1 amino acid ABC transporter membrane protein 2 (PAAT family) [Herbaspirillum sp. SJZ106]TWC67554.1 amino acid ABC transporter membrane protein 2 (PAAT family) [Herbaspirillum sp. SJZ099]